MRTLTMKFGGSSVGTTTALSQILSIIVQEHERWDRLILVVSALEGVTDALGEAAELARLANRRGYRRIVATIRTRHLAMLEELPLDPEEKTALQTDIDQLLFDMMDICQTLLDSAVENTPSLEIQDSIIGVGEKLAARIVAALIRSVGLRCFALDTTDLIMTNDRFGSAIPDMISTQNRFQEFLFPMLERKIIPVLTGYIGATPDGRQTTLGRGGSDLTAAIVAACTESEEVWMWTDVGGLMSTDPQEIPEAQVIPEISYEEIAELSYFGARIIHSGMIGILQEARIPIRIRNIYRPQEPGTLIHRITRRTPATLRAVTLIQGIALFAEHSQSLHNIQTLIHKVLQKTGGPTASVTISIQTSVRSFICVVMPPSAGPNAVSDAIHAFQRHLIADQETLAGWQVSEVSLITIIGNTLSENPHITGQVMNAISNIPLLAMSQGPASSSVSFIVAEEHALLTLKRIHDLIV